MKRKINFNFLFGLLLVFVLLPVSAADFIVPNSSGDPIIIDVSSLNAISDIDVSIGDFANQPRTYKTQNTRSIVIFPSATISSEKTIQLRAGGSSITKTVSFRSAISGELKNSSLPEMKFAKGGNSVTKLTDGRIVLAGGSKSLASESLNSIEIFDPETGKTEPLKTITGLQNARLKASRGQHSATYLGISEQPVGKITGPVEQILLAGGFSKTGTILSSIEILEIKLGTNQCTSTILRGKKQKLKKGRIFHTANLLPDGRVVIVGGLGQINSTSIGALSSIEIYDPVTKSIQTSGISLNTARLLHTATVLQNGNILIAGGFTNSNQTQFLFGPATDEAELIESANLKIRKVGRLKEEVGGHSAVLLTNGQVLIIGGCSDFFAGQSEGSLRGITKSTLQFYSPASESFDLLGNKDGGNLELQTARFLHQSLLLPNGDIVVAGGLNVKGAGGSGSIINTPVSSIEVFSPDLSLSGETSLKAQRKAELKTFLGRVYPTLVLVTPRSKNLGFLTDVESNSLVNCAIYLAGGFTNGSGQLPTKSCEFIQIQSNDGVEGRRLKLTPESIIKGGFLSDLFVQLDDFSKLPALKVDPQSINLSTSNNFSTTIKVSSSNNDVVLLKTENPASSSIVVSPSTFQVGENVTITRINSSVQGQFDLTFSPVDTSKSFVPAKVKINVSDSAKSFLATVPGNGISISNDSINNVDKVQLKVLSQDGKTEITSFPSSTAITATVLDPTVISIESGGFSSATGTLATQFFIRAVKPGKTDITFAANSEELLPISIPVIVSGVPTFSNNPLDANIQANLINSGIEFPNLSDTSSTGFSFKDLSLSTSASLFPTYVPVNLISSVDGAQVKALFTIRPVFGIDLQSAVPRTLVNNDSTAFRSAIASIPTALGGLLPSNLEEDPIAVLSFDDGLRTISYESDVSQNITNQFTKFSSVAQAMDLKLYDVANQSGSTRIVAVKESMLLVVNPASGDTENSIVLSDSAFELELIKVNNQQAAVVSVGMSGIDLVLPLNDPSSKVVNFMTEGNTKNITVVNGLANIAAPFAIAYDGTSSISVVNLSNVNAPFQTFPAGNQMITKIDYGGKFKVNGSLKDVLVATTERKILLFDLNTLTSIPLNENLGIKTKVEDMVVIDGVAYLALGSDGILAVSIGALIDSNNSNAILSRFTENKLVVVKQNSSESIISRTLNSTKLSDSKPFLLSAGEGNNLTVIKVSQ